MSANHSTAQPQHEDISPARQQELSQVRESIQKATALARKNGTRIIMRDFTMPPEWMSPEMREAFSPWGLTGLLCDHDDEPGSTDDLKNQAQATSDTLDQDDDHPGHYNIPIEDTDPDMAMLDYEEDTQALEKALLASKVPPTEAAIIDASAEEYKVYDSDEMEPFDPDQGSDVDDSFFFGDDDPSFGAGNERQAGDDGDEGWEGDGDEGKVEDSHKAGFHQGQRGFNFVTEKLDLENRLDSGERQLVVPMQGLFDHVETSCMDQGIGIEQAHTIRFLDKGVDMTLEEILPIARKYDDPRSWMYDTMVEYLVDEHGPYPPDSVFISPAMNQLYLWTGQDKDREFINRELKECVRQARDDPHYTPPVGWPFRTTATNVRKAVMAWNPRGTHWVCVSFLFDEASSRGRVEVRNSLRPGLSPSGALVGTDMDAVTYLRAFGEIMAVSPHVNLPHLTWNEPVRLVEQTRQTNTIDCGPIAMDAVVNELHNRPTTVVRGAANVESFGLELRTRIIRSVHQKILGHVPPPFKDSPATATKTVDQHANAGADADIYIDPVLLQEQNILLKVAAMQKGQEPPKASTGLQSQIGNNDSDIEEIEKGTDGRFRPVSTKDARTKHAEILKFKKLLASVKKSNQAQDYAQPLSTLLSLIEQDRSFQSRCLLGFEQMCRFMSPLRSQFEILRSGWYSESMVDAVVTLARSSNATAHFIPVQEVQTIIADDAHERFMQHVGSDSNDLYPRMASLPEAPQDIETVVFAWLAHNHWTTIFAQRPRDGSVGVISHFDPVIGSPGPIRLSLAKEVLPAFMKEYARKLAWPSVIWVFQSATSARQRDAISCGPLAVENCLELLDRGYVSTTDRDTASLRLRHFQTAWQSIRALTAIPASAPPEVVPAMPTSHINYRELLCNALENGDGTEEELFGRVREQLTPELYEGDDFLDQRLVWCLKSTPSTFTSNANKWSLIQGPGHNLSTTERLRLETLDSPARVFDVQDYLRNNYCLIVVVVRTSRGYRSRKISDQSKPLAAQAAEAFWCRFGSSKAVPRQVKSCDDWATMDHTTCVPFFELVLDNVSSSESLSSMLESDDELIGILDSIQGRVVLLQANPDGSSTDIDSFSNVLDDWPDIKWDLMIYMSVRSEDLLTWGVLDNAVQWFQMSLDRLVDLWQGQTTGMLSAAEQLINNGHEQMLYMMQELHCARIDYFRGAVLVRCKPWTNNGIAVWFYNARHGTEFSEGRKSCEDCKSETTIVEWKRGSSSRELITLRCDRHPSSADMITIDDLKPDVALKQKKKPGVHKERDLRLDHGTPSNLKASTKSLSHNPAYHVVVRNNKWESVYANVSIAARLLPHTHQGFIRQKIFNLEKADGVGPPPHSRRRSKGIQLPFYVCEPCDVLGRSLQQLCRHYASQTHQQRVTEQDESNNDPKYLVPAVETRSSSGRLRGEQCVFFDGKPHWTVLVCDLCGALINDNRPKEHFKEHHEMELVPISKASKDQSDGFHDMDRSHDPTSTVQNIAKDDSKDEVVEMKFAPPKPPQTKPRAVVPNRGTLYG